MQTDSSPSVPFDHPTPPAATLAVTNGADQPDLDLTLLDSFSPAKEAASEPTEDVVPEDVVPEPVVTEDVVTEDVVTEPVVTEPDVIEDVVTEDIVTEDIVTEEIVVDVVTEDVVTEPVVADQGSEVHAVGEAETAAPSSPAAVIEAGGLQSGQLVTGAVLSVDANEVVIQLPDGRLGVIGRRHLTVDGKGDPTEVVKVGDLVETAVLVREDRENRVVLSRTWAQKQRAWAAIEASVASGEPVNGLVVELVKGGLTVDIGVRAFLPASQVDLHHVDDLASLVGSDVACLVVEADRVTDKVVVSRRNWLRQVERRQANELASTLAPGQVHRGRVVTVTDFGAFVDIGGVRGLLHLSELSWNRVEKTSDIVSVGQEIDVQILSLKGGSKRISLSMRAVKPDPLEGLLEGERLLGVVTRLVDFGAFVKVKDDIEGLVHVSELAEYRVHLPEEVVTPGDEVWVKVVRIDRKRRRLDLSVNQAVQY